MSDTFRKDVVDPHMIKFLNKFGGERKSYPVKNAPNTRKILVPMTSHDAIYEHLHGEGYRHTAGYGSDKKGLHTQTNHESMVTTSDNMHHPSGISASIRSEHGDKHIQVYFADHGKPFKTRVNENMENQEFIQQSLADKDIDSSIKDGKIVVHKDNNSKAKSHLKKIGHGHIQVISEQSISFADYLKDLAQ